MSVNPQEYFFKTLENYARNNQVIEKFEQDLKPWRAENKLNIDLEKDWAKAKILSQYIKNQLEFDFRRTWYPKFEFMFSVSKSSVIMAVVLIAEWMEYRLCETNPPVGSVNYYKQIVKKIRIEQSDDQDFVKRAAESCRDEKGLALLLNSRGFFEKQFHFQKSYQGSQLDFFKIGKSFFCRKEGEWGYSVHLIE